MLELWFVGGGGVGRGGRWTLSQRREKFWWMSHSKVALCLW